MMDDYIKDTDPAYDDFTVELGIGVDGGGKKGPPRLSADDGGPARFVSESAWVIPYGNLMTILMIFFLMLYAYSMLGGRSQSQYEKAMAQISREMGGDAEHLKRIVEMEKETAAAERMESFIKDRGLDAFANVEINAKRVKIMLSNPVLFDLGSSTLKPGALETLKEISALIKNTDSPVVVEGHTDNLPLAGGGKFRSNFELSAARSFSVIKSFIEDGAAPDRFTAFGYGEHRALYPNDTEENRAKNRRIEISILRK